MLYAVEQGRCAARFILRKFCGVAEKSIMNYFISDTHLGHEAVIKYDSRPFSDVAEMDEAIIARWNAKVTNGDTVYIVGDLCWETSDAPSYLSRLKGKKVLIIGNHDEKWLKRTDSAKYFNQIAPYSETEIDHVKITLCHYPMLEWRNSRKKGSEKKLGYLIHGHTHKRSGEFFKPMFLIPHALNAGADLNDFTPVTFDELVKNNEAFKLSVLDKPTDRALFLAEKYHLYQTDRSGVPYVEHPKAVAAMLDGELEKCVGLLHDLLEDTDIDIRLLEENFPPEVVAAVVADTRVAGEDYFDYIARVAKDPIATRVKLADLTHNMDTTRLRTVTDADSARLEKYKKAYAILSGNR